MSYVFIPAALHCSHDAGIVVYVKYGSFPDEMLVIEDSPNYSHLRLPDRELYIVTDSDTSLDMKVFDWDECVPISPFHKTSNNMPFSDIVMINYVEHYGHFDRANLNCRKGCIPNRTKVICDSGGFQLMRGRVDFIEPKNLANFYNKNADMGVILDIPLYRTISRDTLKKVCKVQNRNTQELLNYKDDTVELVNVCHGYSVDNYSFYLDTVTIPEIDRLCIAGLYLKDMLSGLSEFIHIVEKWRNHYKHFHILGVYNISALSFYIYLAEKIFPDILITSDASTPLQSARSRLYHHQSEFNDTMQRMIIGSRVNGLKHFNSRRTLPCTCPVCRAIKYMDVFSFLVTNKTTRLLNAHNMFEIDRAVMGLGKIAQQYDWEFYKDLLLKLTKNHRNKDTIKRACRFMDIYLETGSVEKAEKAVPTQKYNGLFNTYTQFTLTDSNGETVDFDLKYFKDRVEEVLKMFTDKKSKETFKIKKAPEWY